MPPLTVAIDARHIADRFTSNRTYWLELTRHLIEAASDTQFLLFSDHPIPENTLPDRPNWREIRLTASSSRFWSLVRFPLACKKLKADVAHMQYTVSPLFAIPTVTTIHDVSFFINPEWFSVKDRTLLRASVPASARRAKRVIAVSETSKEEILRYVPMPAKQVAVTHLAAPSGFGPSRGEPAYRQPYFLSVGTLTPRKNWRLAIEAVAAARDLTKLDLALVITGKQRDDGDALQALIRKHGAETWLHLPGPVPENELPGLYSHAAALLHPSFHEGFGLTPLEAFACGTPVICSNQGSLPEVVGDAAITLDPSSPTQWAAAIADVLQTEVAAKLVAKGRERGSQFSWAKTARETLEVYRQAAR